MASQFPGDTSMASNPILQNQILEKGNQIDPSFKMLGFCNLMFLARLQDASGLVESCKAMQENINFNFLNTLNKGSIWFPFSRI